MGPFRMRTKEQAQGRKQYFVHLPWWRKPLLGYLLTVPFISLTMLFPLLFVQVSVYDDLVGVPAFLATVLIAWLWGTGPAIVTIVLGILSLNFFFRPPTESLTFEWGETLPVFPLLLAQLVVAMITAHHESARQRELQRHASELELANQAKEHFFSLASHELKTPITLVSTQIQYGLRRLAKQKELPPEAVALKELLEEVNIQTRQLQGLVKDILDLSLLGAKQMPLRIEHCDLSAKCREIIETLEISSDRAIVWQAPPTPIMVDADYARIGQVIINLITNAIKYSPEASTIGIAISQSESEVTIQVHNDGQPIPNEQQEHLFEPFYRTPNVQASPMEGSGLGLAISKEIVERHQGRIWVASSSEKGTSFFVQLPLIGVQAG